MSPLPWKTHLLQLIVESATSHYHQLSWVSDARSSRIGELTVNTLSNLEVLPPFHPSSTYIVWSSCHYRKGLVWCWYEFSILQWILFWTITFLLLNGVSEDCLLTSTLPSGQRHVLGIHSKQWPIKWTVPPWHINPSNHISAAFSTAVVPKRVLGPAATTSSGNLLEIQITEPHFRPTESGTARRCPAICVFPSPTADCDAGRSLRTAALEEP